MEHDRDIQEIVARCASLLVYYQNCGRTAPAREIMEADVEYIAARVKQAGLTNHTLRHRIVYPVMIELLARYETAEAMDLADEFVSALAVHVEPEFSGEFLTYLA